MNPKRATVATHKGLRPYQEDRVFTASYEKGLLLGVFDGHGGHEASQRAVDELPGIFADEITEPKATVRSALRKTIRKLAIMTQDYVEGTTLSLAFIPFRGSRITCAVIGDSPILIKDAEGKIVHSPEHNVRTNEAEAEAVRKRGGFVANGYAFHNRFGVGLQMARALGDAELRKVLSTKPDIYSVKVNKDSFVIVASDGVFDPGHYGFEEAAAAVVKMLEDGADAQAIVDRAVAAKTGDNASAIVARFEAKKHKPRKETNGDPDDNHQAAVA